MPQILDPTTSEDPEVAINAAIQEAADYIARRDNYYLQQMEYGVGFDEMMSKENLKSFKKDYNEYKINPDHFNKKSSANRRLVARVPMFAAYLLKKKYGQDVLTNPDKFWDVMNKEENKIFLRAFK